LKHGKGYLKSNFYIKVSLPSGYKFITGTMRSPSQVDLSTGVSPYFNLQYPNRQRGVNAPVQALASSAMICILHFNDLSGNCMQDVGEPGIPGINSLFTVNGTPVNNTLVTDENGWVCFEVPCPETLMLKIDPQTIPLTQVCTSNPTGNTFTTSAPLCLPIQIVIGYI
jgi:hypothetical protein